MPDHPNLLLILTDQQRADTIGAGPVAQFCRTPNLDALASESAVLTNHYCNAALCVPSRNSLLTAAWPQVNGAVVNGWSKAERPFATVRPGFDTLYEALARSGYDVIHLGVDHLRFEPPLAGRPGIRFATSRREQRAPLADRGITPYDDDVVRTPCIDFECGRAVSVSYTNPTSVVWNGPAEMFFDPWLADRAAAEIPSRGGDRPFALVVNFWSPHCPISCPEPYFSMYAPDAVPIPADVGRRYPGQSPLNLLNTCGIVAANTGLDTWRRSWAVYLGMVTLVDEAIGRVLDALRQHGLWDDTLVWVTNDHGEMLGSHGLFQKMCLYDPAVRVPGIVKLPGNAQAGPVQIDALTQHLDVAPTILDLCGLEPIRTASTGPLAGRSLRGVLKGRAVISDRRIITGFDGNSGRSFHQRAMLDGRYKLIHNHGVLADDPPGRFAAELYDLVYDPLETRNCLADPTADEQAVAGDLLNNLRSWMAGVNDLIPPPDTTVLRPR